MLTKLRPFANTPNITCPRLVDFLVEAAEYFRANNVTIVYETIRLIEQDKDSFLAWTKQSYACTIFNLSGIERTIATFRSLIDMAIARGWQLLFHLSQIRH